MTLRQLPGRVAPDADFLSTYADGWQVARRARARKDRRAVDYRTALEQQATALRRPQVKRRDLVGWLNLVYDQLPDGEFTNQDIYKHEAEFQAWYPDNREIKAKIRQKLQELEKFGFVEHVARGVWRKV